MARSEPSVDDLLDGLFGLSRRELIAFAAAAFGRLQESEGDTATVKQRHTRIVRGPHRLASFQDVVRILGISESAAQRRITRDDFPAPVYRQRRSPGTRLWKLVDIERYATGGSFAKRRAGELQDVYLDRSQVAEALELAPITVTTLSSPKVPDPAVSLGGLQLWLRKDIARSVKEHAA